jgi:hypothetical protein
MDFSFECRLANSEVKKFIANLGKFCGNNCPGGIKNTDCFFPFGLNLAQIRLKSRIQFSFKLKMY